MVEHGGPYAGHDLRRVGEVGDEDGPALATESRRAFADGELEFVHRARSPPLAPNVPLVTPRSQ